MELHPSVIEFFKLIKEDLQKQPPNFGAIYEKAKVNLGISLFHEMTEYFIQKGYNPLDRLEYIPTHYLSRSDRSSFIIPAHITRIEPNAFFSCSELTSIVIPEEVTYVGAHAFGACSKLREVTIEAEDCYFTSNSFPMNVTIKCIAGSHTEYLVNHYDFRSDWI